jgi:outer membrane protein OmpA-like peptidoglycan-associated protein
MRTVPELRTDHRACGKGHTVHRTPKLLVVSFEIAFALIAVLATGGSAAAQPVATGLALDRFDPAERGSEWFALDTLDLRGRVRPAIGADLDWGHKPLVLYDVNDRPVGSVVGDQLFVHAGASLVLWDRLRLGFNLPIAIVQTGDGATLRGVTYPAPGAPQIGDIRLGADVRLFGRYRSAFTLAAGASIYLPTGSRSDYTSDGVVRAVIPHVNAAGELGVFVYSAKLGFELRRSQIVAGERFGDDFQFGAAAGARLASGRLVIGPELYGSTVVEGGAFRTAGTPLELLFGLHYQFVRDWRAGVGFGPGIVRGDGAPLFRALASIEWAPAYRDGDRRDGDHRGGDHRGGERRDMEDRDHDGVPDAYDACPDKPGRRSDDPRKNGCPRVRIEERQIKITEEIKFRTDSAEILPESDGLLFEVRDTINAHPGISKVRVEGHTDAVGDPGYNRELSQRRAEAVSSWLVAHGVDRSRLSSVGVGEARPIDTNATEAGRHNNRRVEFHIVEGR